MFEAKANLGNPNMFTSKVVVVPRACVLAWKDGFPKFEECRADEHVVAADLVGTSGAKKKIISHRWQRTPTTTMQTLGTTCSTRCSSSTTWSPLMARGSPTSGWIYAASTRTGALLKASGSFSSSSKHRH